MTDIAVDHPNLVTNFIFSAAVTVAFVCPIVNAVRVHRAESGRRGPFHWFRVLHALFFPVAVVFAWWASSWTGSHAEFALWTTHAILGVGVVGMIAASFPLLNGMLLCHLGTLTLAFFCWLAGMGPLTGWWD